MIFSGECCAEVFVSVDIIVNAAFDCKIVKVRRRILTGRIQIADELAVF